MKEIYLLTLKDGGDDTYCYYTHNKEWFDWIYTKDIKPLSSMTESLFKNKDDIVAEYIKINTIEDAELFLCKNLNPKYKSFENNKAITLSLLLEEAPDNKKELVKWLSENNFEISEEYDGYLY